MNAGVSISQYSKKMNAKNSINDENKIPRWLYALILVVGFLYLIWLLFIKKPGPQRNDFPFFKRTQLK